MCVAALGSSTVSESEVVLPLPIVLVIPVVSTTPGVGIVVSESACAELLAVPPWNWPTAPNKAEGSGNLLADKTAMRSWIWACRPLWS